MKKTILIYAAALAVGAFVLEWMQFRHLTLMMGTEIYIALVGLFCAGLGVWFGLKLRGSRAASDFEINEAGLNSLGITRQEHKVLTHLADGKSNKEIARDLGVSPNTIKSQVTSLFRKMEVSGRVEAINLARDLKLVP